MHGCEWEGSLNKFKYWGQTSKAMDDESIRGDAWQKDSKNESEGLQDWSETFYIVFFDDSGTDKKTGCWVGGGRP